MSSKLLDEDIILSGNEQWMKLDEEWKPVDLDTEEDNLPKLCPVLSSLDLRKTTFDSSFLFKKVRRKVGRKYSKKSNGSLVDYKDFIHDLEDDEPKTLPLKQFYYISGQILSALSVEEICDKIDDIFKSVEKLYSATSTILRPKKLKKLPEKVNCSISTTDLSFDDTHNFDNFEELEEDEKEKSDTDDVDNYIDEAFDHLNSTIMELACDETNRESVTTLVRKFSSILKSPAVVCSPRKKRQCSDKFRELAEFWQSRAFCETEL